MRERDQSRIVGHKKQERIQVRKGNPILQDVKEGMPALWYIPNYGLYEVVNYGNKLYYNKYTTTLE